MDTAHLLSEIRRLPHEEQLRLVNQLWAELDADGGPPLTEAQRSLLDKRIEEDDRNPNKGTPWHVIRDRVRREP